MLWISGWVNSSFIYWCTYLFIVAIISFRPSRCSPRQNLANHTKQGSLPIISTYFWTWPTWLLGMKLDSRRLTVCIDRPSPWGQITRKPTSTVATFSSKWIGESAERWSGCMVGGVKIMRKEGGRGILLLLLLWYNDTIVMSLHGPQPSMGDDWWSLLLFWFSGQRKHRRCMSEPCSMIAATPTFTTMWEQKDMIYFVARYYSSLLRKGECKFTCVLFLCSFFV